MLVEIHIHPERIINISRDNILSNKAAFNINTKKKGSRKEKERNIQIK